MRITNFSQPLEVYKKVRVHPVDLYPKESLFLPSTLMLMTSHLSDVPYSHRQTPLKKAEHAIRETNCPGHGEGMAPLGRGL